MPTLTLCNAEATLGFNFDTINYLQYLEKQNILWAVFLYPDTQCDIQTSKLVGTDCSCREDM